MSDSEKDLVHTDYGPSESITRPAKKGQAYQHFASYCGFSKKWTRFDGGDPNDVSDLFARVGARECCSD